MPILPHMITEALAYISAAIVGGVVSKAVLREKLFSKKFNHIITDALIFLTIGLILVVIAGIIEVNVF
jgi:branched-subunit amino acid transport protein